MATRAALVTGASRGIGLALARALAEDGYALTLTARKPDGLAAAAAELTAAGAEVVHRAANVADEADLQAVVALHASTYGRLDVLVNNAGVGIGAAAGEHTTKSIDLQLDVNLRSIVILYRECLEMLRGDGGAQVINLASIAGKIPQPWLSVYAATKAAVIAYTQAMNRELATSGVRSVALCPAFVDTDMTAFIRDVVKREEMISTADIVAAMRFVLGLSPAALVSEIVIGRSGESL
ncbi:SDR family NAD(P)-dependent oxidoreductase [Conexibacter sp. DBS9H8]|uniref:SDR family NAD(P)-dependent oxidoreductase n=1 Tax=Conexibacter sp. DBS9H8 TaxID=2937801 RepID=UPI00200BA5C3|nr:SDR family oxidoreductase [Conexibacter sp. DBS9H8]